MEKTENMAKIHILGAAAVLVSTVRLEDWKLVEKYEPEALKVTDENGEPVFRVATVHGTGSMNRYGVTWGSYRSEEGYATVTVLLDDEVENKREAVMDVIGDGLLRLTELEAKIPGILEGIREKLDRIGSGISQI